MRKLVAACGILALAACAEPAEDTATEEAPVEEVAAVDPLVGAYTWTDEEGNEVTGHLADDGTSWVEVDGERMDESTWARNDDGQVCLTWTDDETGEATTDCMTFGEVAEDGTVEVTGSDGEVDTVIKVS